MRGSNTKFRREVFDANRRVDDRGIYIVCGMCGCRIDPVRDQWSADHEIALGLGGPDDGKTNGQPLCEPCHGRKTGERDVPSIAKSKRVSGRHFGIKERRSGFRGWRKFNGDLVWSNRK